jgi:hypothetical protein
MLCIRNNITENELKNFNVKSNTIPNNPPIIGIDGSFLDLTDTSVKYILNGCENIKIIKLNGCFNISDDSILNIKIKFSNTLKEIYLSGTNITDKGIEILVISCINLTLIDILCCILLTEKSIETIANNSFNVEHLITDIKYNSNIFLQLANNCKKIKDIDLCRFINEFPIKELSNLLLSLDTIDLYEYNTMHSIEFNDQKLITISENFKNIKRISFMSDDISEVGINLLSINCNKLEEIYMSNCPNINDKCIEIITKNCPKLKTIELNNCKNISDISLSNISNYCVEIRRLHLQYTNISDNGLKEIFMKCKKLEEIFLEGCNISEAVLHNIHDYCEYLRTVNISKSPKINKENLLLFLQNMQIENVVRENDELFNSLN